MTHVTTSRRRLWLWLMTVLALPRTAFARQPPVKILPSTEPPSKPSPPGQFALPYAGSANTEGYGLTITNTSTRGRRGGAILGVGQSGVVGRCTGANGYAILGFGDDQRAVGVAGFSRAALGVYGQGAEGGVRGIATAPSAYGVSGVYFPGVATPASEMELQTITGGEEKAESRGLLGTARGGVEAYTNVEKGFAVVGYHGQDKRVEGSLASADYGAVGRNGKETEGMLGGKVNAVEGRSFADGGKGVAGKADAGANAVAVYGESKGGIAGFFRGKVTITGSLLIERINAVEVYASKGLIGPLGKLFKIDHPLEPADKFLMHSSVESTDRKNMYDGIVTLDETGTAWITLPDWFEALNTDFRYQLTCVGGHASVYIAQEIHSNRFQIAGGRPGLKVCWLVTGTRHDPFAKAHPFKVEEEKGPAERGKYLNPEAHGFPETLGIHYGNTANVASLDAPTHTAART